MFEIIILSTILIMLALLGLSVKLIFDKKSEFKCGSCMSASEELSNKGVSCACGHEHF